MAVRAELTSPFSEPPVPSPASTASVTLNGTTYTYTIEGSNDLATFGINVWPAWVPGSSPLAPLTNSTTGTAPGGHFASSYVYRSFSLEGSNGLSSSGFLRAKVTNP